MNCCDCGSGGSSYIECFCCNGDYNNCPCTSECDICGLCVRHCGGHDGGGGSTCSGSFEPIDLVGHRDCECGAQPDWIIYKCSECGAIGYEMMPCDDCGGLQYESEYEDHKW